MGFGGTNTSITIKSATDVSWDNLKTGDTLVYEDVTKKFQNKNAAQLVQASAEGVNALATKGGVEGLSTNATATGDVTLNLNDGNIFSLTLSGDVALSVSGATDKKGCSFTLYIKQGGGNNKVTWPAGTKWSGGAPTISTTADAVDIFVMESLDGGQSWYASLVGTDFK